MEAVLQQVSKRNKQKQIFASDGYMPRIYEVQSPCQWLKHCNGGKCPAFVKINGNFYCAKNKKSYG